MLLEINPVTPEPRKIRRAVDALRAGEVIAYPTDTVYGIGCDLFDRKAVDRLYHIKGMPKSHQLSFICRDFSELTHYAVIYDREFRLMKRFLPGPYCFILPATRDVPKIVQSSRKAVGVRIPAHPVAHAIVEELGHPIISSTAARTGADPHVDPSEIDDDFQGLAMILDGGPGGLKPTTVVDLTGPEATVIREGAGDASLFQ